MKPLVPGEPQLLLNCMRVAEVAGDESHVRIRAMDSLCSSLAELLCAPRPVFEAR